MTARALYREAIPLMLSRRAAAHLLGIDRGGPFFQGLIRSGRLRLVPCGAHHRIPLEDCQRVAREGIGADDAQTLRRSTPRVRATTRGVGDKIRAIDLGTLAVRRAS